MPLSTQGIGMFSASLKRSNTKDQHVEKRPKTKPKRDRIKIKIKRTRGFKKSIFELYVYRHFKAHPVPCIRTLRVVLMSTSCKDDPCRWNINIDRPFEHAAKKVWEICFRYDVKNKVFHYLVKLSALSDSLRQKRDISHLRVNAI